MLGFLHCIERKPCTTLLAGVDVTVQLEQCRSERLGMQLNTGAYSSPLTALLCTVCMSSQLTYYYLLYHNRLPTVVVVAVTRDSQHAS